MSAQWTVEHLGDHRLPYRIRIVQSERTLLAVRAQRPWPGAGSEVFCLRETPDESRPDESMPSTIVERVPVANMRRLGRKLSVTLDRANRKRCEFLKVEKRRADGRVVEQVFFRTQKSAGAHRSRGRVELVPQQDLNVVVDVCERYPWRFPGATVRKRRLPVGDYALLVEERPVAVVERKSLANFLSDVGRIKVLHQQLAELGGHPRAAFVVEAQYCRSVGVVEC